MGASPLLTWSGISAIRLPTNLGQLVGGRERLRHRQNGFDFGLLSSTACTISGNPRASSTTPTVICGSRRRSLVNPGARNPSPGPSRSNSVMTSSITEVAGPNPT